MEKPFHPLRALLKGLALYLLIALLLPFAPPLTLSLYNTPLIPGRSRLPFGESPAQAYNLSLFSLDAMFAAHEVSQSKPADEYRVLLIGDSSVWGLLLKPEETLSAQLNLQDSSFCGKSARFYNLGYPTISILKDLLIFDRATRYQPDYIIWLTTLEEYPLEKQLSVPLVANNSPLVHDLIQRYDLPFDPHDPALVPVTPWSQTLFGQRRALADQFRLQLYGLLWAATGIDQVYPASYPAPQTDFEAGDDQFHHLPAPLAESDLAYEVLSNGIARSPAPVLLVNEPILVSTGQNSDIRYNFFYPRWAYDAYRVQLSALAKRSGWNYLDVWNLFPASEFTNSGVHLTPAAETLLARQILQQIQPQCSE